ncbi:MAG TPA: DUF2721 domain-containing protein [Woeseiaceae bacterium]|nr:DUF2721 domain-containing protein [Woeseiaceae bacterium]
MSLDAQSVSTVAQTIQISVAPVFLFAGISGLLMVLTTRLGRIIDRARIVEGRIPHSRREDQQEVLRAEAAALWRRIRLMNWSIRLCVGGALTICLVVVSLFVGVFTHVNVGFVIAAFFVVAMLLIISGLLCLLYEVGISTSRMRQGIEIVLEEVLRDAPGDRRSP